MDVLFVASYKDLKQRRNKALLDHYHVQSGISYISAVLKQAGHNTRLLVVCRNTKQQDIASLLDSFNPGLVCFTAVYSEYEYIKQAGRQIRALRPGLFQLAGGVHVSLDPETAVRDGWDAVCAGEGESAVLELVEKLAREEEILGIPNLCFYKNGELIQNPPRPFIEDLSSLPAMDREMWQPWLAPQPQYATILLGRGCPFNCTYCCNHVLKKLARGTYVRIRQPGEVMEEVRLLVKRHPSLVRIHFEIETIGIHSAEVMELAALLKDFNQTLPRPLAFSTNIRVMPNHDFSALAEALQAANFESVGIGVESGCQRVRREHLNRIYTNDDIRELVAVMRKAGIKVMAYLLIGIPGESREDFAESVALLRELQFDMLASYIVFPYPGTRMYIDAVQKGYIAGPANFAQERTRATMVLPGFSRKQIEREFDWLLYKVYKGHWPIFILLYSVMLRKITRWGWFGLIHLG